ncbi:hypothetical protein Tco_1208801, partial [Tanacetum coccineum]
DRWVCDLVSDGNFRVKEIRNYIDDLFPSHQAEPRLEGQIHPPIKVKPSSLGELGKLFYRLELKSDFAEASLLSRLFVRFLFESARKMLPHLLPW